MEKKMFLSIVILALTILSIVSARVNNVTAQEAGGGGLGGPGGAGGAGGSGGGFGGSTASGSIAAHGEFVYVVKQGTLYQLRAYDLTHAKRTDLSKMRVEQRSRRGAKGDAGQSGIGGDGGNGGRGGSGGSISTEGVIGRSEDVAAYGEFVYVLSGDMVHKLTAEDLEVVKSVKLE